jgi:hypothetical protein
MEHRNAPRPVNFKRSLPARLKHDPQVIKWAQRLAGNAHMRPKDLSEEQLAFVMLEVAKRRGDELDRDLFLKTMAETTPALAAPKLERQRLAEDLELIWSQPEMRTFWDGWDGARAKRGPAPDYATGRGLAVVLGMSGVSAHADDAYAELTQNRAIWKLVERLSGGGRRIPHSYENATKQLPRLACHDRALATNVQMIRELARLHPDAGIGERLMIDGMAVPAWCAQVRAGKDEAEERARRGVCPEAGARAIIHASNGKRNVAAGERGSANTYLAKGKFWRGYYLVCIADQASGLPLVWQTMDASRDEASAIIPLMSDLARLWGEDFAPELIAGDSAWDEDNWCRMLEVEYGIHPVFRLHHADRRPDVSKHSRDGTVAAITPSGRLVCAAHRQALPMVGAETARRVDGAGDRLRPGKTSDESAFRIRAECSKGCGRLGLKMQADWSRLTYYPHHGHGAGAIQWRYAMRQAMLTRLNGMEGIWQRLQGGKKLGTDDADRTRIRRKEAHDLLIDLALLSMTAATLADVRAQRQITVSTPPRGKAAQPSTANGSTAPPSPSPKTAARMTASSPSPPSATTATTTTVNAAEASAYPGGESTRSLPVLSSEQLARARRTEPSSDRADSLLPDLMIDV